MEQLNDAGLHDEDHDILFVDDPVPAGIPVYQSRNVPQNVPVIPSVLTDAQVLFGYQVDADSSSLYNESDPISQMLRNMEKSVITEKDAEISVLKNELEEKNKDIVQCNEKMTKLVEYITFVHGEFGKLLMSLMAMEITDFKQVKPNVLGLGPFKNETAKTEFIQNLTRLATNFLSDYENLKRTRELFEKINTILSSRENMTNKQSVNVSNGNISQVHSSSGQLNGSSLTQATPLPPPTNMRRPPPPPSSNTDMPPPVSVSVSQRFNVGTEYPVLSIQEAPLPNLTELTAQSSSSSANMTTTMEPPPSPLNLTMRRPPPSISRNSLQADYGINLVTANKKHGIDHSKGPWGFFCLCNTRFNNSGKLKDHIQYFTMKNFECIICNKRYHKECLLKLHMISSHKIESVCNGILTCSICHGNYQNWNEVREHLIKFHGIEERHLSTKQNNFANGSSKHARDASAKPAHGCICGKRYANSSALSAHIASKVHGKVFKCFWCTNVFQSHNGLKGHVEKYHGVVQDKQNKFGCTTCGKTFPLLAEIRKHRSEVHPKSV